MSATSRSNQIRRARVRGVRQDYLQPQRRRFELEKHWLFRLPVYGMSPRSVWWTFQKRTRPMFPNCRLNELVQSAQRSFKLKKTYIFIFEKNSSQFPQPCSRYSLKSFIPHIDSLAKRSSQGPARVQQCCYTTILSFFLVWSLLFIAWAWTDGFVVVFHKSNRG